MESAKTKREPVKIWVHKVETQNRIRLTKEAAGQVSWLTATEDRSITCVARLGPYGQMLLAPEEGQKPAFEKISASLTIAPPTEDEVSSPKVELARYLATTWTIRCTFEAKGNRFTLVLPKEPRDLGILPSENNFAVIFNTGHILEIWSAPAWVQHIVQISSNLSDLTNLALDAVDSREQDSR